MSSSVFQQLEQKDNPFQRYFNVSAKSISPQGRDMIAILDETPVSEVLHILSVNKILSAPVLHQKGNDYNVAGSIDVIACSDYLASAAESEKSLLEQPIKKVLSSEAQEPLMPFYEVNPLTMLVDLFASGVHRVALFDDTLQLLRPISQTDVLSYLATLLDKQDLTSFVSKPISSFSIGVEKPLVIQKTATVGDALKKMHEVGVSSIGLVDEKGFLVGAFSPSDLRGFEHLKELQTPITEWCRHHSPSALKPLCFNADDSLSSILASMAKNRAHRVWIVKGEQGHLQPERVISSTDIMQMLGTGSKVTSRQANSDLEAHKLWAPSPSTAAENARIGKAAGQSIQERLEQLDLTPTSQ